MNFVGEIKLKPMMKCMMLHQAAWDIGGEVVDKGYEGIINYCSYCKEYFYYPTRMKWKPVYRKFTK